MDGITWNGPVIVTRRETDGEADIVVENDFLRIVIAPGAGGAVTELTYKRGPEVTFIADKGAGVAGTGRFFVDAFQINDEGDCTLLTDVAFAAEIVEEGPDRVVITLVADLDGAHTGLRVERTFTVGRGECGFTLTRRVVYAGAGVARLWIGSASEQRPENWRKDLKLCAGTGEARRDLVALENQGGSIDWEIEDADVQWQLMGQYGIGVVARAAGVGPAAFRVRFPEIEGVPCQAQWLGGPTTIEPGESAESETAVLVYQGLREAGAMSAGRLAVSAYGQRAADPGDAFPVWGSVASPVRKTVTVGILTSYDDDATAPTSVSTRKVVLEPGLAVEVRGEAIADREGLLRFACSVRDEGAVASSDDRPVWIGDGSDTSDASAAVRRRYARRFPELHCSGSWADIGRTLAREGRVQPGEESADPADQLAKYRLLFPYYGEFLEGAARELNVPAEKLVTAKIVFGPQAPASGCMAFFLNGPDGPICAYTKERRSPDAMKGLGYARMAPERGYRHHLYTLGHGINEKGLCTGGASINTDGATGEAGRAKTKKWLADGNITAPMGRVMMLATCATVEEAIRYIENPRAPLDYRGNMLLVDRGGDAAVLQSYGVLHSIRRYTGPRDRLDVDAYPLAATNYTHANEEGLFGTPGTNWGDNANALLREWRIAKYIRELDGQVSLVDALRIMRSQSQPGGVCLNGWDNAAHLFANTSYVGHPATGDLYMTCGHPHEVHFERYRLDD